MIQRFLFAMLLIFTASPCSAVFEGTANAGIFIKLYEQRGEFGKLALWHEAAAECLTLISVPMNEIAYSYYKRHGYEKWAARTQKEALEIQKHRQFHSERAKAAWEKSDTPEPILNAERQKIAKFIATWLPYYPNKFYDFGIYATFFRELKAVAENDGDYAKVLRLEADAAEMCAAQYEQIPIAYSKVVGTRRWAPSIRANSPLLTDGLKNYAQFRDAYLRRATLLRTLAKRRTAGLPPEIDIKALQKPELVGAISRSRHEISSKRKADAIINIAKSEPRVKAALAGQKGVREYAWFQGFAWTVSFYNHGWGNLAIAVIDDKSTKILDVLEGESETAIDFR